MNQQASLRAGSKRRISFSQKHETEQDRATRKLIDLRKTQRMQNHIRSTARNSYTQSLLQATNNITRRPNSRVLCSLENVLEGQRAALRHAASCKSLRNNGK